MIQKSDVLDMNVRVAEIDSQIRFASSNVQNASDYLFYLLDESPENKVMKPTETLQCQEDLLTLDPVLSTERKDLQAFRKSLESYDYLVKSSEAKFLPRLNAFGSFELYDNKPYQFNANGYFVGLELSWNIFDGMKTKSEIAKYKADLAKSETEVAQYQKQSILELTKAYRQVTDADHKVKLSKQAWEQTAEAYRIRKNRYAQGLEKASDVLNAETLMSKKELEYHQSVLEYNTALDYYKFLK